MQGMYREIGERDGRRLAGWPIDGGDAYYLRNYCFLNLIDALKKGNSGRVVTFFSGSFQHSLLIEATSPRTLPISALLYLACIRRVDYLPEVHTKVCNRDSISRSMTSGTLTVRCMGNGLRRDIRQELRLRLFAEWLAISGH